MKHILNLNWELFSIEVQYTYNYNNELLTKISLVFENCDKVSETTYEPDEHLTYSQYDFTSVIESGDFLKKALGINNDLSISTSLDDIEKIIRATRGFKEKDTLFAERLIVWYI